MVEIWATPAVDVVVAYAVADRHSREQEAIRKLGLYECGGSLEPLVGVLVEDGGVMPLWIITAR